MQLNNTYTVNSDGSITLHVAQPPPNPNLFTPGPAFMFINVLGIPSNGSYLIVGSGQIGTQPTLPASVLPPSIRLSSASGTASNTTSTSSTDSTVGSHTSASHLPLIIGSVVGGIAVLAVLGATIGICLARRKRANARKVSSTQYDKSTQYPMTGMMRHSDSSAFVPFVPSQRDSDFVPLQHDSEAWRSTTSLSSPYRDINNIGRESPRMSMDGDPYAAVQPGAEYRRY